MSPCRGTFCRALAALLLYIYTCLSCFFFFLTATFAKCCGQRISSFFSLSGSIASVALPRAEFLAQLLPGNPSHSRQRGADEARATSSPDLSNLIPGIAMLSADLRCSFLSPVRISLHWQRRPPIVSGSALTSERKPDQAGVRTSCLPSLANLSPPQVSRCLDPARGKRRFVSPAKFPALHWGCAPSNIPPIPSMFGNKLRRFIALFFLL